LNTAVAVFGSKTELTNYNSAYAALWGFSENWLDTQPSQSEILDRLRDARRLPERRDFAAWKRGELQMFERADACTEELLHLPNGTTLRVMVRSYPGGGLVYMFDDVTENLQLETAYNSLAQVQLATLNTMQDGIAFFGPDCRLKLHNAAFARLWDFDDAHLVGEPHVAELAQASETSAVCSKIWGIVLAGVHAATPEHYNDWAAVERPDGATIALSLARLPDGATMATFAKSARDIQLQQIIEAAA
jgi:PAS domain-containing protein